MDTSRKKYHIERYLFYCDEMLDIAVLRIKTCPGDNLPPGLKLRSQNIDTSILPNASIIGYGHPGQSRNNMKVIEPHCRIVNANTPEVRSALLWLSQAGKTQNFKQDLSWQGKDPREVDLGYKNYDADFKILFHCYMEHGSSGGPIIRVCHGSQDNAKSIEVIGIVTHGIPEFFFNLSPMAKLHFPSKYRFEAGTRTSHMYMRMKERSRELADHLFLEPMDIDN